MRSARQCPGSERDMGDPRPVLWRLRSPGITARLAWPRSEPHVLRVGVPPSQQGELWRVQLEQPFLSISVGTILTLTFRGRSTRARTVAAAVSSGHGTWDNLGLYVEVSLDTAWKTFRFTFAVAADEANARLHFDIGGGRGQVEIADVTLCDARGVEITPNLVIRGYYPSTRRTTRREPSDPSSPLTFSVVIPTFQRREDVLRAVRAFATQECNKPFEVIVVVDGSADDTAAALRSLVLPFPLTVVEQSHAGAAAARNAGARLAAGEYLLFLDDDMEAHPRLLAEHLLGLNDGADAVIGHLPLHPAARRTFLTDAYDAFVTERAARLGLQGEPVRMEDVLTGQLSVRRTAFQALGGFDEDFTKGGTYGNEDLDLGIRLLEAGHLIVFSLCALSFHHYSTDTRSYLRQARQTGHADVALARKHPAQAASVFDAHSAYPHGHAVRRLLGGTSGALLLRVLSAVAIACAGIRSTSPVLARWVDLLFELEYWRGVDTAGESAVTAVRDSGR